MGSQGSPVKSYDYLLKFLLVGDSDVGKGEILDSLQDGSAESPYAYSSGESPQSQLTSGWCEGDDGVHRHLDVLSHVFLRVCALSFSPQLCVFLVYVVVVVFFLVFYWPTAKITSMPV